MKPPQIRTVFCRHRAILGIAMLAAMLVALLVPPDANAGGSRYWERRYPTCAGGSLTNYSCQTLGWAGYENPGGLNLASGGRQLDCDDCTYLYWFDSGFTFEYSGTTWGGVYVSDNGFISFGSSDPYANDGDWPSLPNGAGSPYQAIVFHGTDLDPGYWGNGVRPEVYVDTIDEGTANERVVIEFYYVEHYYIATSCDDWHDTRVQLIIYGNESSTPNAIEYRVDFLPTDCPGWPCSGGQEYEMLGVEPYLNTGHTSFRRRTDCDCGWFCINWDYWVQYMDNARWRYTPLEPTPCETEISDLGNSMYCNDSVGGVYGPAGGNCVTDPNCSYPTLDGGSWDDGYFGIDMGSDWRVNIDEHGYRYLWFSTNGFVGFSDTSSAPSSMTDWTANWPPNAGTNPAPVATVVWEDLRADCDSKCDLGLDGTGWEREEIKWFWTGTSPNRVLQVDFYNIEHYPSDGSLPTMLYHFQFYEATQAMEMVTQWYNFDSGGTESIQWTNDDPTDNGEGGAIYATSDAMDLSGEAWTLVPATPCGAIHEFIVTRDTTLACDLVADSLYVSSGVTLTIPNGITLTVQQDPTAGLVQTRILGNVRVTNGGTLFFRDDLRFPNCNEGLTTFYNTIEESGFVYAQGHTTDSGGPGRILVNSCGDDGDDGDDSDWQRAQETLRVYGEIALYDDAYLQTTDAAGTSLDDGWLVLGPDSVPGDFELFAWDDGVADYDDAHIEVGSLRLRNNTRVALIGDGDSYTYNRLHLEAGSGLQLEDIHFLYANGALGSGFLDCAGYIELEDLSRIQIDGHRSSTSAYLRNGCNLQIWDDADFIFARGLTAYAGSNVYSDSTWGPAINQLGNYYINVYGTLTLAGSSLYGYTLDVENTGTVTVSNEITTGVEPLEDWEVQLTQDLIVRNGGSFTIDNGADIGIADDAIFYGNAFIEDNGTRVDLSGDADGTSRFYVRTPANVTMQTGSPEIHVQDRLYLYQSGTLTVNSGLLDIDGRTYFLCYGSGSPDLGTPARAVLAGGTNEFQDHVYVGISSDSCDTELELGNSTTTFGSNRGIYIRGNSSELLVTGGTHTVQSYDSYGVYAINQGVFTISGGTFNSPLRDVYIHSTSQFNMPTGGNGTLNIPSDELRIYGTATVESGTLDIRGLQIFEAGTFTMSDASRAFVDMSRLYMYENEPTSRSTLTIGAESDAGIDFQVTSASATNNYGDITIRGDADATFGGVIDNWRSLTARGNADVTLNGVWVYDNARMDLYDNAEVDWSNGTLGTNPAGVFTANNNARFGGATGYIHNGTFTYASSNQLSDLGDVWCMWGTFEITGSGYLTLDDSGVGDGGFYGWDGIGTLSAGRLYADGRFWLNGTDVTANGSLVEVGGLEVDAGSLTVSSEIFTATALNQWGDGITIRGDNAGRAGVVTLNGGELRSNTGDIRLTCNGADCGELRTSNISTISWPGAGSELYVETAGAVLEVIDTKLSGVSFHLGANTTALLDGDTFGGGSGTLQVDANAILNLFHHEVDAGLGWGGNELTFGNLSLASTGTIDHGDGQGGDIGFLTSSIVEGLYRTNGGSVLTDPLDDANPRVYFASNLAAQNGGAFQISDDSSASVQGALTLTNAATLLDLDGRLDVAGGTSHTDNASFDLASTGYFESSLSTAVSYTITNAVLNITGGQFYNNHLFEATNADIDISGGTVELSQIAAGGGVNLRGTSDLNMIGGAVSVSISTILYDTAQLHATGAVNFTVDKDLVQSDATTRIELGPGGTIDVDDTIRAIGDVDVLDPAFLRAGSLSVSGASADVDFLSGGGGYTVRFDRQMDDIWVGVGDACDTFMACNIWIDAGVTNFVSIGTNVTVETWAFDAFTASELRVDGQLDVAGTTRVEPTGTLRVGGLYNGGGHVRSWGLVDVTGTGTLDVSGAGEFNAATGQGTFQVGSTTHFGSLGAYDSADITNQGDLTVDSVLIVDEFLDDSDHTEVNFTAGSASIGTVLNLWGLDSSDEARVTVDGGDFSFRNFYVAEYSRLTLDGVTAESTTTNTSMAIDHSEITGAFGGCATTCSWLSLNGAQLLLVNDSDGNFPSGVADQGSNLFVGDDATVSLAGGSYMDVYGELDVAVGGNMVLLDAASTLTITRGTVDTDWSEIAGNLNADGQVYVGTHLAVSGMFDLDSTAIIGCDTYDNITQSGGGGCTFSQTNPGGLFVGSGGTTRVNTNGDLSVATGQQDFATTCPDSAGVISAGMLRIQSGVAQVGGNVCLAGTGQIWATDTAPGDITLNVLGETGTNEAAIFMQNGSTLSIFSYGHVVANSVQGDVNSSLNVGTYAGIQPISFSGGNQNPYDVAFPLLQLDWDPGADPANNLTVGDITLSDGTIWADGEVEILGPAGSQLNATAGGRGVVYGANLYLQPAAPLFTMLNFAQLSMTEGFYDSDDPLDPLDPHNTNLIGRFLAMYTNSSFVTNKDIEVLATGVFGVYDNSTLVQISSGAYFEGFCNNGLDDDADGLWNCADPDCGDYATCGGAATGVRRFTVHAEGQLVTADNAMANIDGNLHIGEWAGGGWGGTVAQYDTSRVYVAHSDDASAYLGGQWFLNDFSTATIPSFVLKSSQPTDPATLWIRDNATFTTEELGSNCVTPALHWDPADPDFGDHNFSAHQECSWIFNDARMIVESAGIAGGVCDDNADCGGAFEFCANPPEPSGTPDASGVCVRPGYYTDNRLIINVDQLPDTDPNYPLGLTVDGGVVPDGGMMGHSGNFSINPRRESVFEVINGGYVQANEVDTQTRMTGGVGPAGQVFLNGGSVIETPMVDLDGYSRLVFTGNSSVVSLMETPIPADPPGTLWAPANSVIEAAPFQTLGDGRPGGPVCGNGGGGGSARGGDGVAGGSGGECGDVGSAPCHTFYPDPPVPGSDMHPNIGAWGGSAGGDGLPGAGGLGAGTVWIHGDADTRARLNGNIIANGGDAEATGGCGGGGGGGGNILVEVGTLIASGSVAIEANGGAGSAGGGGGAAGNVWLGFSVDITDDPANLPSTQPDRDIALERLRNMRALGGTGVNPGGHGLAAVARVNPATNDMIDVWSTGMVFRVDPAVLPARFYVQNDWVQRNPIGGEGLVTSTQNMVGQIDNDMIVNSTTWTMTDDDLLDFTVDNTYQFYDLDFIALNGAGAFLGTLELTSSGANEIGCPAAIASCTNPTSIQVADVSFIGASGTLEITGPSGDAVIDAENVIFDNLIDLTVGPDARVLGNIDIDITGNLFVDDTGVTDGALNAEGRGFVAGAGGGPGASGAQGAGGGHGGRGGDASGSGGVPYGSAFRPALAGINFTMGSGGGNGNQPGSGGGSGGGTIDIRAVGTCDLDTILFADGTVGSNDNGRSGGGGAGGFIFVDCGDITGNPTFYARGGDSTFGGGGAGGRVMVHESGFTPYTFDVSGGVGGTNSGQAGTAGELTAANDLYVFQNFALQAFDPISNENDPFNFSTLNSITVTSNSTMWGNFGGTNIDLATVFQMQTNTIWDPVGPTTINLGTFDTAPDSCIGTITACGGLNTPDVFEFDCRNERAFWTDLTLNTSLTAVVEGDACLGDFAINEVPAGSDLPVAFGDGTETGPFMAQNIVIDISDAGDPKGDITVAANFEIRLDGMGFAEHTGGPTAGDNAVATGAGGGGGGYGGGGGGGEFLSDPTYGGDSALTAQSPTGLGGGGGYGLIGAYPANAADGGAGGGAIYLRASNITIPGSVTANGLPGQRNSANTVGGGGGAGGSIYVEADVFDITGAIEAHGGAGWVPANPPAYDGGGGAGGRIYFVYDNSVSQNGIDFADWLDDSPRVSGGANGQILASDGTLAVRLTYETPVTTDDDLRIVQGWSLDAPDGPFTFNVFDATRLSPGIVAWGNTTVATNEFLLDGAVWVQTGQLTVDSDLVRVSTSSINTDDDVFVSSNTYGGIVLTDWDSSSVVAGGQIDLDGSNTTSWNLTNTSFTAGNVPGGDLINVSQINHLVLINASLRGNQIINVTGDVNLDNGSWLGADGYGYRHGEGPGASEGTDGDSGGGGGYGGTGDPGFHGEAGGIYYSSALSPNSRGSSGGDGKDDADGGQGGGHITIQAARLLNSGTISADGADSIPDGGYSGGGGSGGTIYVTVSNLLGGGTFAARGGDAQAAGEPGGGGGGGRIWVQYDDDSGFGGLANTDVRGGYILPGTDPAQSGTAGFFDADGLALTSVYSWRFEVADVPNYPNFNSYTAEGGIASPAYIYPTGAPVTIETRESFHLGSEVALQTAGDDFFIVTGDFSALGGGSEPSVATLGGDFLIRFQGQTLIDLGAEINLTAPPVDPDRTGTFINFSTGAYPAARLDLFNGSEIHGNVTFVAGNVTTHAGTVIDATIGDLGGDVTSPCAPPAATGPGQGGSGGGHGGSGGRGDSNPGVALSCDSELAPVLNGGAGGDGWNATSTGGTSGGVVRLESRGDVSLAGAINVNGSDGTTSGNVGGGGGAGGSILVSGGTIVVSPTGLFEARGGGGGASVPDPGGGGSGGRIALCSTIEAVNNGLENRTGGASDVDAGDNGTYTINCDPVGSGVAMILAEINGDTHVADHDVDVEDDVTIMSFALSEVTANETADLQTVRVTASGTADEPAAVTDIRIAIDADENGIYEVGTDTVITQDCGSQCDFAAPNGVVELTFDPLTPFTVETTVHELILIADVTATLPADEGDTIVLSIEVGDIEAEGNVSENPASVVGLPLNSGTKTITNWPAPTVFSTRPRRASNSGAGSAFTINVWGLNLTGVLSAEFNTPPPHLFDSVTNFTDRYFEGDILPAAPPVVTGYYDVIATTANGSNTESGTKFEFYEFCDTGLLGVCAAGEWSGGICYQLFESTFEGPDQCNDGIDQDCNGEDLSCNGVDDDGDGYTEEEGDCDDDPATGFANSPLDGRICISTEYHVGTHQLTGVPNNVSTIHLWNDSRDTSWRLCPGCEWYESGSSGLRGSSAHFDGVGDYIEISSSTSLAPQTNMTLLAYARFDAMPVGNATLLYKGYGDNPDHAQLEYGLYVDSSSQLHFDVRTADGILNHLVSPIDLILRRWYQFAAVYDADAGRMTMYVDGVLNDGLNVPGGGPMPMYQGDQDVYVGGSPSGSFLGSIEGEIDGPRVFGEVLTQLDLENDWVDAQAHVASSLPMAATRMYLDFSWGMADSSPLGNDGTAFDDAGITGRSLTSAFPIVSHVAVGDSGVDIIDATVATGPQLWMRIPTVQPVGTTGLLQYAGYRFVEGANGFLAIASDSPNEGVIVLDFAQDTAYVFHTGGSQQYSERLDDFTSGTWGTLDAGSAIPDNTVTGLAVEPWGDDILIGIGSDGEITAIQITPDGTASVATASVGDVAAGLVFGNDGNLYFGQNDPASYHVIADIPSWIGGGGGDTSIPAMALSGTVVNDAAFSVADDIVSSFWLKVATDDGLTVGLVPVGNPVAGAVDQRNWPANFWGHDNNIAGVWMDADSSYVIQAGDIDLGDLGGLSHYDIQYGDEIEHIDNTRETNPIGVFPTRDLFAVSGWSGPVVAHAEGLSLFYINYPEGLQALLLSAIGPHPTACPNAEFWDEPTDAFVAPVLVGECAGGNVYPLAAAGPPYPDVCVPDAFASHEYCDWYDALDTNCDGATEPFGTTCADGIPSITLAAIPDQYIPDCAPVTVTLPIPEVADDMDPAPDVQCATDNATSPIVINGLFGDWVGVPVIGTGSGGMDVQMNSHADSLSFRLSNVDFTGDLGARIAVSEAADGVGCVIPTGESGVTFTNDDAPANWVFEVDSTVVTRARQCNPSALPPEFVNRGSASPTAAVSLGDPNDGIEFTIDLNDVWFEGSELQDITADLFLYVWVYDTVTGDVSNTLPVGNGQGPGPAIYDADTYLQQARESTYTNVFDLGEHQLVCTATDFDGNLARAEQTFSVVKTTNPVIEINPPIDRTGADAIEIVTPGPVRVNILCRGDQATADVFSQTCVGGTQVLEGDLASVAEPANCLDPLSISNDAMAYVEPMATFLLTHPPTIREVEWTVQDANTSPSYNEGTFSQFIEIVDTTPPTISFTGVSGVIWNGTYWLYHHIVPPGGSPALESEMPVGNVSDNGWVMNPAADCSYPGFPVIVLDDPENPPPETQVTYECEDGSTNTAWTGDGVTPELWVYTSPPLDPPDADLITGIEDFFGVSDLELNGAARVVFRVGDDVNVGAGRGYENSNRCVIGEPTVFISGADVTASGKTADYWYWFEVQAEGINQAQVTVTSLCSGFTFNRTYNVGIDTVPPVIIGYNDLTIPVDITDVSYYDGRFPNEGTPDIDLLGRAQDIGGSGVESVRANLFLYTMEDSAPPDGYPDAIVGAPPYGTMVANVINEVSTLVGQPRIGPGNVINAPCRNPDWCDCEHATWCAAPDPGGSGLDLPSDPADPAYDVGPYRIRLEVSDAAGNLAQRDLYFYDLDLEHALLRSIYTIERFQADGAWAGHVNGVDLLDSLEAMLDIYRHAWMNYVEYVNSGQLFFAENAILAVDHGNSIWVDVLIDLAPPIPDADTEIDDKQHELARGAGLFGDVLHARLEDGGWTDPVIAGLGQTALNDGDGVEGLSPGGALLEYREGLFFMDLAVDEFPVTEVLDLEASYNMLRNTMVELDAYTAAYGAAPPSTNYFMGYDEVVDLRAILFETYFTVFCIVNGEVVFPPGRDCDGQFGGVPDHEPSSWDRAIAVRNFWDAIPLVQYLDQQHLSTDPLGFSNGRASVGLVELSIENMEGNIINGAAHPLSIAARAQWGGIRAILTELETNPSRRVDYETEATSSETYCLTGYGYNAGYIHNTFHVAGNWYDGSYQTLVSLTDLDLPGCFPPPPTNPTLVTWYCQQWEHDLATESCPGPASPPYVSNADWCALDEEDRVPLEYSRPACCDNANDCVCELPSQCPGVCDRAEGICVSCDLVDNLCPEGETCTAGVCAP